MGKPRPGSVRVKQRAREEQELGESVVSLAGHLAQRTEEKSELGSIPVPETSVTQRLPDPPNFSAT